MLDLESAKKKLTESGYTCVLCKGDAVFCSRIRGVAPLLEFLDSERSFCGFSAADKVVGKGAALLYVLLGVSAVHATVISVAAYAVLREAGILRPGQIAVGSSNLAKKGDFLADSPS